MIAPPTPTVAPVLPPGWEHVEVLDGVVVDDHARRDTASPPPAAEAGTYDRFGRPAAAGRCGRHVSLLA